MLLYFICHTLVINQWEIANALYILAMENENKQKTPTKTKYTKPKYIDSISKLRGNATN